MSAGPMSAPRLSIVIVTYNSRGDIDTALRALREPRPRIDHELVVVDNASPDGTARHVRMRWPDVRVIDAGGNVGFAAANNIGIRQTTGELVLLLNPDTRARGDAVDRLAAALEARHDAAVIGPRIVDRDGRAELSFGPMIAPLAELRQKVLVIGHHRRLPVVTPLVERMTRRSRDVDWVSGACLMIRRDDLVTAGLLDERFFMYTEDVDLCAAVRSRGKKVVFLADAQIEHLRGRSVATSPGPTALAYRRSQMAFYEKHHPRWAPILETYLKIRGRWPDNQ
jgi:N-acetylglucosaminyl-diphospho-decaprenol L-rhamnosyltransferase